MSVNQMIARGINPGAGMVQGAKNAYAMKRQGIADQRYNDETAYRNKRNAMMDKRYDAEYGQKIMADAMRIPDPEARIAFVTRGIESARAQGINVPPLERDDIEGIRSMPSPTDPNAEWDRREKAKNAEWDRRQKAERSAPPTPTQSAQQQKAIADAAAAELKLQGAKDDAEQAKTTKTEIQELASSLLKKNEKGEYELADGVSRVYGAMDRFLPSFGEAYSAEADVDRLADLLTLGNMGKMKGVLSDADIKILKNAGSILGKKGLPEARVLEELKKIAGVFEGAAIDELVEKYAGK